MYLRGCKFSYEKVKQKIDMWHTVRTHCPDLFEDWSWKDPKMKELINCGINVPIKGYDKHGRKVIILNSSRLNPDKFSMAEQFRASLMINELLMASGDEQAGICGAIIVQDVQEASIGMMRNFSPSIGKKAMTIFQEAYPSNPKAMFFLGLPSFLEPVFNVMMSFSKEKFRQRIQMCTKGDFSKLHQELGTEVLPKEYGGTNGCMQDHIGKSYVMVFTFIHYICHSISDDLVKSLEKKSSWLSKQYKYKSNEKKRPGKEKLYSDIFGMEGSFRQLSVD